MSITQSEYDAAYQRGFEKAAEAEKLAFDFNQLKGILSSPRVLGSLGVGGAGALAGYLHGKNKDPEKDTSIRDAILAGLATGGGAYLAAPHLKSFFNSPAAHKPEPTGVPKYEGPDFNYNNQGILDPAKPSSTIGYDSQNPITAAGPTDGGSFGLGQDIGLSHLLNNPAVNQALNNPAVSQVLRQPPAEPSRFVLPEYKGEMPASPWLDNIPTPPQPTPPPIPLMLNALPGDTGPRHTLSSGTLNSPSLDWTKFFDNKQSLQEQTSPFRVNGWNTSYKNNPSIK